MDEEDEEDEDDEEDEEDEEDEVEAEAEAEAEAAAAAAAECFRVAQHTCWVRGAGSAAMYAATPPGRLDEMFFSSESFFLPAPTIV